MLRVADISRHPGPVFLTFRLDPSVDPATVHQVREVHTRKLLDLVLREEVVRDIFFLLDPVKEYPRCFLLIHGKGDHIVRQEFPGKLSGEDDRVVAVVTECCRRRCVRHDLRAAARADIDQGVLFLLRAARVIILCCICRTAFLLRAAGLRRF